VSPRVVPLVAVGVIVAAFAIGYDVRQDLPRELTPAALRGWIGGLGWKGAAAFLAVVVFRQFLFVPAAVILAVGGLCFGVPLGTALGATGIILSAAMKFSLARGIAQGWAADLPREWAGLARRIERTGPLLIGAATAYPFGPLSPLHWAAGLTSLRFLPFLAVVLAAAPVRALALSLLGARLAETRGPIFACVTLGFLAATLLPLAHPGVRRWLFDAPRPAGS
jgi:uncharacterized membrane protein YdjX (TVP38/TMEM64 family)